MPTNALKTISVILLFLFSMGCFGQEMRPVKGIVIPSRYKSEYYLGVRFTAPRVIADPEAFIKGGADTAALPMARFYSKGKKGATVWLLSYLLVPDSLLGAVLNLAAFDAGSSILFIGGKKAYATFDKAEMNSEESFLRTGQLGKHFFIRAPAKRIMLLCKYTYLSNKLLFLPYEINVKTELLSQKNGSYENYFSLACAFILLSFGILFFFLFIYATEHRYNLYFALFSFSVATLILYHIFAQATYSTVSNLALLILISNIVLWLILFLRKLINPKTGVFGRILLSLTVLCAIASIALGMVSSDGQIGMPLFAYPLISMFLIGTIEVVRVVVRGLIEKKRQARFTGLAILFSVLTFSFTVFSDIIFETISWNGAFNYQTVLFALSGSVFPFFMAVNLAVDFSKKNKQLAEQVETIRDLSDKNLQKEIEKQEIILKQNEMLEMQVLERTQEIRMQKELIEAKQKEIIDSIHYARRIQRALITSEKYISRRLDRLMK